jgi:molybdenum cofactor synthesis domain-containing protein
MKNPTAAVLVIGNEILTGRTQDTNVNAIAKRLLPLGIVLSEVRVVPDIEAEIVAAVNALRGRYDYVLTTGGIGPTHDDITAASMAVAFNRPLIVDPTAHARLLSYYGAENLNDARLRMARMPEGSTLIDNPVSTAPGFQIENVSVMAGVPNIMQAMMDYVAARLKTGPSLLSRTINCFAAESLLADRLAVIAQEYPDCDIGSYPWFRMGQYGLSLVVRGTDTALLDAAAQKILALAQTLDVAAKMAET